MDLEIIILSEVSQKTNIIIIFLICGYGETNQEFRINIYTQLYTK